MPAYPYKCTPCDRVDEHRFHIAESHPATLPCPACGGDTRKTYTATPVVFRGSGFYSTDTRR